MKGGAVRLEYQKLSTEFSLMSVSRVSFLAQAVKLVLEIRLHSRKSLSLNIGGFLYTLLKRSDCLGLGFGFA